jgi:hypothetical protein
MLLLYLFTPACLPVFLRKYKPSHQNLSLLFTTLGGGTQFNCGITGAEDYDDYDKKTMMKRMPFVLYLSRWLFNDTDAI